MTAHGMGQGSCGTGRLEDALTVMYNPSRQVALVKVTLLLLTVTFALFELIVTVTTVSSVQVKRSNIEIL